MKLVNNKDNNKIKVYVDAEPKGIVVPTSCVNSSNATQVVTEAYYNNIYYKNRNSVNEYSKLTKQQHDFLKETLRELENIVGYAIFPIISYNIFKSFDSVDTLVRYIRENSMKYSADVSTEEYLDYSKYLKKVTYEHYSLLSSNYPRKTLSQLYSKFDTNFTVKDEFASTLEIMNIFLSPTQLLAAILKPKSFKIKEAPNNEIIRMVHDNKMQYDISDYVAPNSRVSSFSMNLYKFDANMAYSIKYYSQLSPIHYESTKQYLVELSKIIHSTFDENRNKQYVELLHS